MSANRIWGVGLWFISSWPGTSQWTRNREKGMNPSSDPCFFSLGLTWVIPPTSALRVLEGPSRVMTSNAFQKAREKHRLCGDLKPRFHLLKFNLTLSWPAFSGERFVSSDLISHPLFKRTSSGHTDTWLGRVFLPNIFQPPPPHPKQTPRMQDSDWEELRQDSTGGPFHNGSLLAELYTTIFTEVRNTGERGVKCI